MRLRNVEFADAVPKSEIPRLLARSDAGLMVLRDLPLFSYGVSPNKLFDYWGAGLPVICNVPGEVAGWVRSAAGGVQADGPSPQALADAVRQMLALGPERRMRMGEQGREWVRREHDRAMLAGRLHEILISMVERAS
jgi:glycosyltransferase involved in cell wall biosynthesis